MVLLGSSINEGTKVESAQECQELCQNNNECKAFTLETTAANSKCWLKHDGSKRKAQLLAISGPKNCRKLEKTPIRFYLHIFKINIIIDTFSIAKCFIDVNIT